MPCREQLLGLNMSRGEEEEGEEEEEPQLTVTCWAESSVTPRRGGSPGREHSLLEVDLNSQ